LLEFELASLQGDTATVRFRMIYERPDYYDETYKELILNSSRGFWLMERESNLGVSVR